MVVESERSLAMIRSIACSGLDFGAPAKSGEDASRITTMTKERRVIGFASCTPKSHVGPYDDVRAIVEPKGGGGERWKRRRNRVMSGGKDSTFGKPMRDDVLPRLCMKPLYSEKERCRNGSFPVTWGKDSPILTALFLLYSEATHPGP